MNTGLFPKFFSKQDTVLIYYCKGRIEACTLFQRNIKFLIYGVSPYSFDDLSHDYLPNKVMAH